MEAKPRSWWGRNWKWVIPTGCFGLVVILALFVGGIVAIVFGGIRSSDVYETALARAQANPEVVSVLGQPIEPRWYVSGSINVSGSSGEADLAIPIAGPNGHGIIYAVAHKRAGRWSFEILQVECESREGRIELTDGTTSEGGV